MKYYILYTLSTIVSLVIVTIIFTKINVKEDDRISSYFNSSGSFAGFIQKKNGLIRACEFSTNGTILSCSKWFDSRSLKQGQNQGIAEEDI